LGVFSVGSGTGRSAAPTDSSPSVADLPEPWLTTPFETVISAAGTPQDLAAAATIMARAVAPAVRYCSKEFAMAVEPPVPCTPNSRFL